MTRSKHAEAYRADARDFAREALFTPFIMERAQLRQLALYCLRKARELEAKP